MGVTIWYTVTLSDAADVKPFLASVRREAKARKWRIRRTAAGSPVVHVSPHERCEDVRFDFSEGLVSEDFTKTSSAPIETHVGVVEFLRTLEPLVESLEVDDEGEYWQTGDLKTLERHRGAFEAALKTFGNKESQLSDIFTCGGIGLTIQGPNGPVDVWINPPYVNNDTDPSTITAEWVASLPPGAVEYSKRPKR